MRLRVCVFFFFFFFFSPASWEGRGAMLPLGKGGAMLDATADFFFLSPTDGDHQPTNCLKCTRDAVLCYVLPGTVHWYGLRFCSTMILHVANGGGGLVGSRACFTVERFTPTCRTVRDLQIIW